jgi:hypothetical protein
MAESETPDAPVEPGPHHYSRRNIKNQNQNLQGETQANTQELTDALHTPSTFSARISRCAGKELASCARVK